MNSFDDYSPWADSIETISRFDKIACLFLVILHRKYSQRYNKYIYIPSSYWYLVVVFVIKFKLILKSMMLYNLPYLLKKFNSLTIILKKKFCIVNLNGRIHSRKSYKPCIGFGNGITCFTNTITILGCITCIQVVV